MTSNKKIFSNKQNGFHQKEELTKRNSFQRKKWFLVKGVTFSKMIAFHWFSLIVNKLSLEIDNDKLDFFCKRLN